MPQRDRAHTVHLVFWFAAIISIGTPTQIWQGAKMSHIFQILVWEFAGIDYQQFHRHFVADPERPSVSDFRTLLVAF